MKKKLLALVLSVIMIAALFVPVLTASAAEGKVVVEIGEVTREVKGTAKVLKVPVNIVENTHGISGLLIEVVNTDGMQTIASEYGDVSSTVTDQYGIETKIALNYTIGTTTTMVGDNKTKYNGAYGRILADTTVAGKDMTGTGYLATLFFLLPETDTENTVYSFKLGDIAEATNNDGVKIAVTMKCKHTATEEQVVKAATCTEAGSVNVVCKDCGEVTDTKTVAALGHDYQAAPGTTATCTEPGKLVEKCSRCGDEKTKEVAALGHDLKETSRKEATCTEDGEIVETCQRDGCDYVKKTPIAKLGHDFSGKVTITKEATATEKGEMTTACVHEGCTEVEKAEIPVKKVSVTSDNVTVKAKDDKVLPADLAKTDSDTAVKVADGLAVATVFTFESKTTNDDLSTVEAEFTLDVSKLAAKFNNMKIVSVKADGTTEEVTATIADGKATFSGKVGGVYAVVGTAVKPLSPQTADATNSVVYVVLALLAVSGLAVIGKKRLAL